jgi:hypothetical protein
MRELKTGSVPKGEKLSQDDQTSDRFGIKRRKAVTRRANFKQVRHQKAKSCHKMIKLQTGSASKGEKLSKEEGNSDKEAKGSVCQIAK